MRWLKSKNSRPVLSKEELFLFYLSRLLLVEVNHARYIMTGIPTQTTDWLSCRGFCFVSHQTSVMGIRTALNSNHGKYEQTILSLISWQTPSRMRRICFHWELVIKLWGSHQRKKEKKTNSPIVLPNVASTLKKTKLHKMSWSGLLSDYSERYIQLFTDQTKAPPSEMEWKLMSPWVGQCSVFLCLLTTVGVQLQEQIFGGDAKPSLWHTSGFVQ